MINFPSARKIRLSRFCCNFCQIHSSIAVNLTVGAFDRFRETLESE